MTDKAAIKYAINKASKIINESYEKYQVPVSAQTNATPTDIVMGIVAKMNGLNGKDVLIVANYDVAVLLAALKVMFAKQKLGNDYNFKSLTLLTDIVEIDPRFEDKFEVVLANMNEPAKIDMMGKKFDVVIGNPPYQLADEEGESNNTKVLYDQFVYFAKRVGTKISFVLPSNYFTGNKGPLKKFRKFIKTNGLVEISEDKSDHFKVNTAGISILTLDEHKQDTYTFQGVEITNDFTDSKIVTNQKAAELYSKLTSLAPTLRCSRGKRGIYKSATEEYSTERTDQYSVPMFLNTSKGAEGPNIAYVKPNPKMDVEVSHFAIVTQDWNKEELTFNKIWHRKMDKFTSNLNFIYFLLDESETFESFLSYVNSKVFKFLLKHSDTGSRALPIGSLKKFPTVSFDREWTDEALYDHFNLSAEEVDQFNDLP